MLGRFRIGAPTVRAWTVTIREEARTEFKILEPSPKVGVEASHAHHYTFFESAAKIKLSEPRPYSIEFR